MKISFQNAKNGELTAVVDNLFLHSSYNPSREAQRFVDSINVENPPALILVLEPAVSYIIPLLKKKFNSSKIGIIRYCKEFSKFNDGADYIFDYFNHKYDFANYLFNSLGEENIFGALILQWQPSSKIFNEIEDDVLKSIKTAMEKAKTLLVTREFFEKKWLINSCNFIKYINHPVSLKNEINLPILILSSGPSLNDSINAIKENRNKVFIMCLSSAIRVCINNDIIPDLCVSTDGGFWAGEHLKSLQKHNIPLALPFEGYCQKNILKNNMIMPLSYPDGISKTLADKANITYTLAERNGTVSGTALILALSIGTNDIYFAGLDMSSQRGFQHCQPNEIEFNNCIKDNFLNSKEYRLVKSEYAKGVLGLYKEWFDFLNLGKRKVYRVIEKPYKKNSLGQIKDIKVSDFLCNMKNTSKINSGDYFKANTCKKDFEYLKKYFKENFNTEQWKKNIFPLSMTALRHTPNNTDIIDRLEKDMSRLNNKIENIFND